MLRLQENATQKTYWKLHKVSVREFEINQARCQWNNTPDFTNVTPLGQSLTPISKPYLVCYRAEARASREQLQTIHKSFAPNQLKFLLLSNAFESLKLLKTIKLQQGNRKTTTPYDKYPRRYCMYDLKLTSLSNVTATNTSTVDTDNHIKWNTHTDFQRAMFLPITLHTLYLIPLCYCSEYTCSNCTANSRTDTQTIQLLTYSIADQYAVPIVNHPL